MTDDDLDMAVWAEVFGVAVVNDCDDLVHHSRPCPSHLHCWTNCPDFISDGNAMLTLLQRFTSVTFDGHEGRPSYWHVAVWTGHGHTMPDGKAKGATLGEALCLAALTAVRATKEEPDHADD
jgi:hypothetical protein